MNNKKVYEFVAFCTDRHDVYCNQTYGALGFPYSWHLHSVIANVKRFSHLIPEGDLNDAIMIAAGHDLIEDARLTYNEVKDKSNERIAEGIFLCTEMRGRTRQERKSERFYKELARDKIATFVKLCDIAANTMQSLTENSNRMKKAIEEWPIVKRYLFSEEYEPMFIHIEMLHLLSKSSNLSDAVKSVMQDIERKE